MRPHPISALALAVVLLATQGSIPAGAQTPDAIPTATLEALVLISPAASPARPGATHLLSHADSLAFQSVSRLVGPQSRVRVYGATGPYHALGSDVTLQGIRLAAPGEAGGSESGLMPWSEIHEVQVRGSAAGEGAKVGATTFGVIGVALAVVLSTADIGLRPSHDVHAGEVVVFTLGVTTAGAILGGMIGALSPRWKTIHSWAGF